MKSDAHKDANIPEMLIFGDGPGIREQQRGGLQMVKGRHLKDQRQARLTFDSSSQTSSPMTPSLYRR
jgi:hypothetical protein